MRTREKLRMREKSRFTPEQAKLLTPGTKVMAVVTGNILTVLETPTTVGLDRYTFPGDYYIALSDGNGLLHLHNRSLCPVLDYSVSCKGQ